MQQLKAAQELFCNFNQVKNLLPAFSIAFILVLIASGCKKEDDFESSTQFQVIIEGLDPITFYNPECEFGMNEFNQFQFSGPVGNDFCLYSSSYWNDNAQDSILDHIWISFVFLGTNHTTEQQMELISNTLDDEHDSNENVHFFVEIQMKVNGLQYTNSLLDHDVNTPEWETNDSCYYRINLFDGDYHIKCLDKDVMVINLDFQGKLYAYDVITKIDSIEVQAENLNLLFERQ